MPRSARPTVPRAIPMDEPSRGHGPATTPPPTAACETFTCHLIRGSVAEERHSLLHGERHETGARLVAPPCRHATSVVPAVLGGASGHTEPCNVAAGPCPLEVQTADASVQ